MSGRLFIITKAKRYNFGEHWRVWAEPVVEPVPEELNEAIICRGNGLVVPISDYENLQGKVAFCVDCDLPGEEQDYVGVYVLRMDSSLLAFL